MIIRRSDRQPVPSAHGEHVHKELLLRGGIIPALTQVAESTIGPASAVETHNHPTMWEFFFVLSGEATYVLDGEEFKSVPVTSSSSLPAGSTVKRPKAIPTPSFTGE